MFKKYLNIFKNPRDNVDEVRSLSIFELVIGLTIAVTILLATTLELEYYNVVGQVSGILTMFAGIFIVKTVFLWAFGKILDGKETFYNVAKYSYFSYIYFAIYSFVGLFLYKGIDLFTPVEAKTYLLMFAAAIMFAILVIYIIQIFKLYAEMLDFSIKKVLIVMFVMPIILMLMISFMFMTLSMNFMMTRNMNYINYMN